MTAAIILGSVVLIALGLLVWLAWPQKKRPRREFPRQTTADLQAKLYPFPKKQQHG